METSGQPLEASVKHLEASGSKENIGGVPTEPMVIQLQDLSMLTHLQASVNTPCSAKYSNFSISARCMYKAKHHPMSGSISKHLEVSGGIWVAFGGHLGSIWRHLGGIWAAGRWLDGASPESRRRTGHGLVGAVATGIRKKLR